MLAPPYLYSGPSPVASLATTLAGLEVNRKRGDRDPRRRVAEDGTYPRRVAGTAASIRRTRSGLPIIEIPLADHEQIDAAGRFLFERGIYVTMAAFPLVPRNEVGVRIQVTAANTEDEVGHLISVLRDLDERFPLQQPPAAESDALSARRSTVAID